MQDEVLDVVSLGPVHVACATDAGYFRHCATMLASLLEFNPGAEVHVLCDENVAPEDQASLTQWGSDRGASITCTVPKVDLPKRMPGLPSLTRAAWLRLFLPQVLPALARVIYVDVDLIVQDSLQPLWRTSLDGNWLAAVSDIRVNYASQTHEHRLSLPAGAVYFNSGVMLIDLAAFGREQVGHQALRFADEHSSLVKHADQDPLNVLLHGHRLPLDLRWNVQSPLFEDEAGAVQPYADREIREATAHPAIVHFSGPWKPWHVRSRHPLRGLYPRYRKQTPWPEWQLDGRTWKHRLLRWTPESLNRRATEMYWSTRSALRWPSAK